MVAQYTITGMINSNGTVLAGTGGFQVEHVDNGVYTILFQPAFTTLPVVVTSQVYPNDLYSKGGSTLDNSLLIGVSTDRVRIHTGDGKGGSVDRVFTFIAIGGTPSEEDFAAAAAAAEASGEAESGIIEEFVLQESSGEVETQAE